MISVSVGVMSNRVVRGGCWDLNLDVGHPTYRYHFAPYYRYNNIGFR